MKIKNTNIKCIKCKTENAFIFLEEGRYFVNCTACGYNDYLKTYNKKFIINKQKNV